MKRRGFLAASAGLSTLAAPLAAPAFAQGAPIKIGMITTLSGPGGYLGQDIRDAFQLAVEQEQGKLGGTNVQVLVEDDGLRPGQGKSIAERFLRNERIKLMTGVVFSNVLGTVAPDVLDADGIYVSPNAAPSGFAGRECHRNYYTMAWQNDTLHETAGVLANTLGYKRMFILAPNYQAGRDALTGFKRKFGGEVVQEVYTRLDQTDYAAELAQIRAARPDAVFQFHPGGLGIGFLRQYAQAGLLSSVPQCVPAPSMDSTTLAAVGEAAEGLNLTSHWNTDFQNPASQAFVAAFRAKYNRTPTYYAQQGYDTALAIGAALRQTRGSIDPAAFRTAMLKADFQSTRGKFAFGPNQHPVQDWYALKVEKVNGALALVTKSKILENEGDSYAAQCRL
ncbi:ABC transporter substrate-binding protein [Rhodovarius crocodyli]|uniref:ABC transporter substrate-binding protein n=1 Tax=Rhodovarius crocodyli TaxID=1979269 RepID=A0A437LYY5_9PROT|nr:ABC transporter substrate-binding protein [Rhodovarius crocodyli]RVT90631.1 ABC transporter substrate-binding protein [Rhodovarius crocodyli]